MDNSTNLQATDSGKVFESNNGDVQLDVKGHPNPSSRDVETLVEQVYKQVVRSIRKRKISVGDISLLVVNVMGAVEKLRYLSGQEKKELVVEVVDMIVENFVGEEDKDAVSLAVRTILPSLIDTVVQVSKGLGNLNKKSLKKMFSCCNS